MLLRSLLRSSLSEAATNLAAVLIPTSTAAQHSSIRSYSAKKGKPDKGSKNKPKEDPKLKKGKNSRGKVDEASSVIDESTSDFAEDDARGRRLAEDENDKSLDVGPNGRPLFTTTGCLSELTKKDVGSYIKFSTEELATVLPEGLPVGLRKEFEDSKRTALLVRSSFLELRDNFRRIVDPPLQSSTGKGSGPKKQIVLDGPRSCGKSIALAMLVKWAREEGWLVFYVPQAKDWTHGGFFYKNDVTDSWDTPLQAHKILEDFTKYNESRLLQIRCKISDPIPLGEGPGLEPLKDIDSMDLPGGATLLDLVKLGMTNAHAAVGVVIRLRCELSLITDIPVLIAIDQYNNWFTFTEFEWPSAVRACKQIHARELSTVYAFRSMMHNDMMIGAFSHSTAVGKLRKDLPDVPPDARIQFPRYSLDEAEAVSYYYLRQRLIRREAFSDENWKRLYYLSNGNGCEMRWLLPFMRDEAVKI